MSFRSSKAGSSKNISSSGGSKAALSEDRFVMKKGKSSVVSDEGAKYKKLDSDPKLKSKNNIVLKKSLGAKKVVPTNTNAKTSLKRIDADRQQPLRSDPRIRTNVTVNSPRKIVPSAKEAAKSAELAPEVGHKRYPTKTLDTEEIKVLNRIVPEKDATVVAVPRAEPKAFFVSLDEEGKSPVSPVKTKSGGGSDGSYEDDFDSYDSDFEAYTSSSKNSDDGNVASSSEEESTKEEIVVKTTKQDDRTISTTKQEDEKKFDSGSYELFPTSKSALKASPVPPNPDHHHASLTDEGFNDDENSLGSSGLMNVEKKKPKTDRYSTKRYDDLKGFIRLDEVKYSLFEMLPMDYDTYISIYGKSNTNQMHSQTNDDAGEAEIQTEPVPKQNKWTEHPVNYSHFDFASSEERKVQHFAIKRVDPLEAYESQRLGVGSASNGERRSDKQHRQRKNAKNIAELSRFVRRTGAFVLRYLEGNSLNDGDDDSNENGLKKISVKNVDVLFKRRPVERLLMGEKGSNALLTVHSSSSNDDLRSYVCVWTLRNRVVELVKTLVTPERVECCALNGGVEGLTVAGLDNGNICAWDLSESKMWHIDGSPESLDADEASIPRKVSFHSGMSSFNTRSSSNIWGSVSDVAFIKNSRTKTDKSERFIHSNAMVDNATQMATLQELGLITVWTVVVKLGDLSRATNPSSFEGCDSHWSRVSFLKTSVIDLNRFRKNPTTPGNKNSDEVLGGVSGGFDMKRMTSPFIDDDGEFAKSDRRSEPFKEKKREFEADLVACRSFKHVGGHSNSLLVVRNDGTILNCPLNGLDRNRRVFRCDDDGSFFIGLDTCPVDAPYFLAACDDGAVHLYSLHTERPIKKFIFELPAPSSLIEDDAIFDPQEDLKTEESGPRWYGHRNVHWLPAAAPFEFVAYHERAAGIVVWDLKHSDMAPKRRFCGGGNGKSREIANLAVLREADENYLVVHFNRRNIKMIKLDDWKSDKRKDDVKNRLLLIKYLESL